MTTREEDLWLRRATAAAVDAGRKIIADLPPSTPVARLSDHEWGWIIAAVIAAWVSTKSQQAATEGRSSELTIRMTGYQPDPFDAGAVAAILPELAETPGLNWSMPIGEWPRNDMIAFLLRALDLARQAMTARDLAGNVVCKAPAAACDLDDQEIPF